MTLAFSVRLLALPLVLVLFGCGGDDGRQPTPPASFSVSPTALTFSAPSASAPRPAPQALTGTLSGTIQGNLFINIGVGGATVVSVSNVQITGDNTGHLQVIPTNPSTLGPGSHTETITVRACTTDAACSSTLLAGTPAAVSVTYNISGVRLSASSLTYTVNDGTTSADLTRQLQLSGYPAAATWTATSSAPWLTVPSTGSLSNGAGQLAATINQAELDAIGNDSYSATIRVVPASGDPVTIPVTLNVDRSEVSFVTPYVATEGSSREIVIRGQHLPASPAVSFGGVAASSVTRVSDTEIRATYPANLALGRHTVQVAGVNRSLASLLVVNTPAFTAERLALPQGFRPRRMLYDAERQTLVISAAAQFTSAENELIRFTFASGAWGAAQRQLIYNLHDVALSLDGSELLVTKVTPLTLQHLAASDLSVRRSSTQPGFEASSFVHNLAIANDGLAILGGEGSGCGVVSRYTTRGFRYTVIPQASGCTQFMSASADASIILGLPGGHSGGAVFRYIASTGELTTFAPETGGPGFQLSSPPIIDRHATRFIMGYTRVYNADLSLLGLLPPSTKSSVLSPDGAIAWTYDLSGEVRKFDLTAPPNNGLVQESGPATALPASPDQDASGEIRMTSTPEAEALFIAGDDGVVVLPAP